MTNTSRDIILRAIEVAARTGKLGNLEIEFWMGGGAPPPNYRSDQLRLMNTKGKEVLEFASLRWDSNFDPPNLQEKWTAPLEETDTSQVARLILSTRTLTAHFAEEEKPGIADIFSYEILVTLGGRQEKRTYYRKLPDELSPLRSCFEGLIKLVESRGSHGLYHQGQEVKK